MVGQYLSHTNKRVTVAILQKKIPSKQDGKKRGGTKKIVLSSWNKTSLPQAQIALSKRSKGINREGKNSILFSAKLNNITLSYCLFYYPNIDI